MFRRDYQEDTPEISRVSSRDQCNAKSISSSNDADGPVDEEERELADLSSSSNIDSTPSTHPFVTYNSLASSSLEAGPSFANAYFASHPAQNDSLNTFSEAQTPISDVRTASSVAKAVEAAEVDQEPTAAALFKRDYSPEKDNSTKSPLLHHTQHHNTKPWSIIASEKLKEEGKDASLSHFVSSSAASKSTGNIQKMRGLLSSDIEIEFAENPDLDDAIIGCGIEDEIRNMMERVQIKDTATSVFREMGETPDELCRIGHYFVECMRLRNKYMEMSLQHEADNPKNKPGWKIYPPPPTPAWHDYKHNTNGSHIEDFDLEKCEIPGNVDEVFGMGESGVFEVYSSEEQRDAGAKPITNTPSIKEYFVDLNYILETISDGPIKTWAFRRLKYLDARWQLYIHLNEREEMMQSKMVPHRDLYNVRKVDGHVHLASAMNQKHLLRFIKYKLKTEPDMPVIERDGKVLTLRQVFESLNLTAYDLSIDTLDMHAHKGAYHRFDKFNLKYNPIGESRLRTIFMKTDNYIHGKFFAQLTKEVASDLEASKYQMAEYRISIYGRSADEWDKLAAWVVDNKVFSSNVRWLIQVPRLYNVYKASGLVENFEQVIRNIFEPLFEVTKDPSSHPKLHVFLQRVVGFDSVDDESKPERRMHKKYPLPRYWKYGTNPPYSYYCYFTMANMCALNQWRAKRGFNTFVFRPHAGEAGDTEHLAAAFLAAQGINHGILLRKVPALQYLYYLQQIGLAMSPLSNNALFLVLERNPFNTYFERGLNVALSTDDPLQFHFTKEPLMEEYSIAAQIWKYTSVDMCELAMNSVIQSGFEAEVKRHWIGEEYLETGQTEVHKTNVPLSRLKYRAATLEREHSLIAKMIRQGTDSPIANI